MTPLEEASRGGRVGEKLGQHNCPISRPPLTLPSPSVNYHAIARRSVPLGSAHAIEVGPAKAIRWKLNLLWFGIVRRHKPSLREGSLMAWSQSKELAPRNLR
jgi:hypothetical protein